MTHEQTSTTALRRRALRGDRAGDAAGGARPDDPGHRPAHHRPRPRSRHRPGLAGHRLRGRGGSEHAAVGQAGRPARSQAPARDLAGDVSGGLRALRGRARHRGADRRPRRPGRRGRRPHDACHGRRRRPGVAARTGAVPGLHRRHVRGCHRGRAAAGRRDRPARRVAVGVLRQPPDRPGGAGRTAPAPAGPARRGCSAPARRPGRGLARRRDGRLHTDLRVGRPPLSLGVARGPGAGRPHRRPRARTRPPGAARRRSDRPLRTAPHRHHGDRLFGPVPDHGRPVCGQRVRAALPADHDRRDPDRGRAAAGADDARASPSRPTWRGATSPAPAATSDTPSPARR